MKKIALLSLAAAALTLPAAAQAQAPATTTTTTTATTTVTAPTKVELKDGSWAMVGADGAVTVSKDGGKTWMPAPDGTWEAKDGSKIMTKGGKAVK